MPITSSSPFSIVVRAAAKTVPSTAPITDTLTLLSGTSQGVVSTIYPLGATRDSTGEFWMVWDATCIAPPVAGDTNNMPWTNIGTGTWEAHYENTRPHSDPATDRVWILGGGTPGGSAAHDRNGATSYFDWASRTYVLPPRQVNSVPNRISASSGAALEIWDGSMYVFGGFANVNGVVGRLVLSPVYSPQWQEVSVSGSVFPDTAGLDITRYTMFRGGVDRRTGQLWYLDKDASLWIFNHDGATGTWVHLPVFGTVPPLGESSVACVSASLNEKMNCIVAFMSINAVPQATPQAHVNKIFVLDLGTLMWRTSTIACPVDTTVPAMVTYYDRHFQRTMFAAYDQGVGKTKLYAFEPGAGPL